MSRFPRRLKSILVMVIILQAQNIATGSPRGGSRSSSSSSRSSPRSSYGSSYGSNYGSTYGSGSRHSYSPPSYSSLSKTFSLPTFDLGHNLPKGPPPAYSAHDTVGGAPTNIRERPPAYKPPRKQISSSLYHNQYQGWTTSRSNSNRNYRVSYNCTNDFMCSAATSPHYPIHGYTYLILISTFLYVYSTLL